MKTFSFTIPANPLDVQLLRALKGAPLSCLGALHLAYPSPLGRSQLHAMTGWAKDKITDAMRLLVDVFGFAARLGRYESWCLTDKGKQLKLPFFQTSTPADFTRALSEGEKIALPPSSSSYLLSNTVIESDLKTTTTGEGEKIALPKRIADLIEEWFDGCPKKLAKRALETAHQRGDPPVRIEYRAIAWTLYTQSPMGKNIKMPAIFVARKIEQDERCPMDFDKFSTMEREWRRNHKGALERLEELDRELDELAANVDALEQGTLDDETDERSDALDAARHHRAARVVETDDCAVGVTARAVGGCDEISQQAKKGV